MLYYEINNNKKKAKNYLIRQNYNGLHKRVTESTLITNCD